MRARKRRAYLEYFHRNAAGEYVYAGDLYAFWGDGKTRKRALTGLWSSLGVSAALTVLGGCVPVPGLTGTWYILAPYVVSAISVFAALWSLGELTAGGDPLREYVYEKSRKRLKLRLVLTAVFAALSFVGETVYLINAGGCTVFEGLFLGWEAVCAAAAGLACRMLSRMHWEKQGEAVSET